MAGGEILGLDPATRTGVAFGAPGQTPQLWTENFGGEDATWVEIYANATYWLADFLRTRSPAAIAIEEPVPPSAIKGFTNHATTMVTIGLFGVFTGIIGCKKIKLIPVRIQTWRKHFLGAGNGNLKTKEAKQAALRRCRQLGWEAPGHDAAEAGGIFDWGCAQLRAPTFEEMSW